MPMYSIAKLVTYLFLLLIINLNMPIASSAEKMNLLLISSYHPNFPTFYQQIDGLKSVLPVNKYNLDVEFMDSKRFPGAQTEKSFLKYLTNKVKNLPPYNLIFTSDDNAFNFIVKYQDELFPNTPIVFFGVNNLQNAELQNKNKHITGVVEATSIKETIRLAQNIIPNLSTVIAISDGTASGVSDLKSFLSLHKDFSTLKLSYLSLTDLSWDEITKKIQSLNSQTCILLLSAYRDKNNTPMLFTESLDLIITNSSVPVFHLWEHGLNEGIIGGKLISHFKQGMSAGIIAKEVLSGNPIENIPVKTQSPNITILDYKVLNKFGISINNIPSDAIFINKPYSIFQKYKNILYVSGLIFTFMTICIFILIINIQRRKNVENQLRKSEETFKTLYNKSSHYIGLLSPDGKIISTNIPSLEVIGLSISDVCGLYFWDSPWWRGTGDEKKLQNELKKVANGETVRFFSKHNIFDNQEIIVDFTANPVFNEDNVVTEIIVEALDITETRKIEDRLRHIEKMESVGILAGGIAHDFNNMLGGIIGCAELMQKHLKSNPDANNLNNMIIESSEKAAELIQNLLVFSRKQQIVSAVINVHKVISDSIMLLTHTIDKRTTINSNLFAKSPYIIGDQSQIQNVILNLGINASHAMPDGGILTITTSSIFLDQSFCSSSPFTLSPGYYLQIDVSDNGCGIDTDNIKHIFDPFFTTKEQGKGTGLGLSAVYGAISQHLGAISVYSKLGNGTVFHIYLPLSSDAEIN